MAPTPKLAVRGCLPTGAVELCLRPSVRDRRRAGSDATADQVADERLHCRETRLHRPLLTHAFALALMNSNCAFRSGCWLPSMASMVGEHAAIEVAAAEQDARAE